MKGNVTSGICSTRRRAYENRPSTTIPTITMVANTGFLIETRVTHMTALSRFTFSRQRPSARAGGFRRRCRSHQCRCAGLQVVKGGGQDRDAGGECGLDLDPAHGVIAPAYGDDPARELAILDGPDERLPCL